MPRPLGKNWVFRALRSVESAFGPGLLSCLLPVSLFFRILERSVDYAQFKRLRSAMPPAFWRGVPAWLHFCRVFRNWVAPVAAILFYDRLGLPRWRARMPVEGKPPDQLPEWGKRPVLVVYLHAGGLTILKDWLRSRGMPTVFYVKTPSPMYKYTDDIRAEGDRIYGLEGVPDHFVGKDSLRETIRFLAPGHVLMVAMEQMDWSKQRTPYPVEGGTMCLNDMSFRLAVRNNAILLPVSVRLDGFTHYRIKFGQPVPDHLVKEERLREANQFLLDELWKEVKEDPSCLTWTALEALSPDLMAPRKPWP